MEADGASQADLRSNMKYAAAPSAASPRGTAATSVSLDMTARAAASSAAPPRGMAEACVLAAAPSAATLRGPAPADKGASAPAAAPSVAPPRGTAAADVQSWREEAANDSLAAPHRTQKHAAAPSAALPRGTAAASVPTYRARILDIYRKHNPCMVSEVDGLLAGYQGRPYCLYLETCIKHGVPSEPPL